MPLALAGPRAPDPNAPPPVLVCRRATVEQSGVFLLLVAFTAALPSRCTTVPMPCPDAGLLRLCASFHDANARSYAAPDDGMAWRTWLDRRWGFSTAIEATAARTEAGRQAKARVALVLMQEAADTSNEYERTVLAVLRDLAGSAAA